LATGAVGVAPAGHARGSHGCRFVLAEEGAVIAADGLLVVVVGADGAEELLVAPPVVDGGGAFTANCVPVTTVTLAPLETLLGS
jgi:hypothetical protein